MTAVRPPAPTHRGVVQTRDLWFDRTLLGDDEARRRVLGAWRAGASLRTLGPGWLLSLPSPVRVDTRRTGATVLLPAGTGRLASVEGPVPAGTWLFRGGQLLGGAAESLPLVDPSAWLDEALPSVVSATRPLGDPPAVQLAAAPLALDLRSRLGFSAATTQALQQLFAELPAVPGSNALGAGLQGAFARMLGGLAQAGNAVAGRSALARSWLDRLDAFAGALGLESLLSAAVGAHNARYLQELMSKLEGGDWLEAVMRGIPLGGESGSGGGGLAWLSALQGLQWRSGAGTGSGVGAGPDFYQRLAALYQKAFEALDAQGRIREAAYVLAELLGKVGDAVEYLEQKREYQLAAELAEAKRLDPGRVVHLWILAGDEDRALALAAVHEVYGVAVEHLERRGESERALGLRLRWAHREHRAGRVVAAVDIAWKVEVARPIAREWLGKAVGAGGTGGARALARSLLVRPEAREADLLALDALVAHDTTPARSALAEALDPGDPLSRKVLRATTRALLRDQRAGGAISAAALRRAAERCADGALLQDLPTLPTPSPASWPTQRVHHAVDAGDTGLVPLFDAVPLPRDRWLVATGETGAWIVDRDGRRQATLAAPTHHIVTNPGSTRLLLLGRRPDRWRIHHLWLPERTVTRWVDLAASSVCGTTDGSVWFVAQHDRVVALDLQATTLRALWSVDGLARTGPLGGSGGAVLAMDWEPGALRILVPAGGGEVERFQYALPTLALRERRLFPVPPGAVQFATTSEGFSAAGGGRLELVRAAAVSRLERAELTGTTARGALVAAVTAHATELYEPDGLGFRPKLVVETSGAGAAWCRIVDTPDGEPRLVVGDDRGRLRVVDLRSGTLCQDLRLG